MAKKVKISGRTVMNDGFIVGGYIMKKAKWKTIVDGYVRAVWVCPTCGSKVTVPPESYQDVGTPICDGGPNGDSGCEGDDMQYARTEILI